MILEDLTTAICNASDELKVGCNSSIASLRFSLLDSMSAVEVRFYISTFLIAFQLQNV